MNSKLEGSICETKVLLEFQKLGYNVSKPVCESSQYDLIVDIRNKLYKVQVKKAKYNKHSVECKFYRVFYDKNTQKCKKFYYNKEEIDIFACVCLETDKVYIIEFEDMIKKNSMALRLLPVCENQGQTRIEKTNWAFDFELEKWIMELEANVGLSHQTANLDRV